MPFTLIRRLSEAVSFPATSFNSKIERRLMGCLELVVTALS
jgi:hypothetical protein